MDPQRQTPRCKRTHPGFTGWNHSKMPLQTPGGTKKVSGMDWQKASDHEVIMISIFVLCTCTLVVRTLEDPKPPMVLRELQARCSFDVAVDLELSDAVSE